MTIVIDPGHGGTRDNGTSTSRGVRGPRGTLEKDVTMRLARGVARHLGGRAALTRDEQGNPTLEARSAVARDHDASVFVSIHANAGSPGTRGSEVWVHDRATPPSMALSHSIQRELGRLGGPDRGTWRGNLAVLAPNRLGPRTAACLVEVDYLSNPDVERRFGNPGTLDGAARAIARAIDNFVRQANSYGGVTARALDGFDDVDQLDAMMKNARAMDTLAVSSKSDAHEIVSAFRTSTAVSPWISLSRSEVANRLDELIDNPTLLDQGNLNLCGPAAFLTVWTKRDPLEFAAFATTLFDTGRARIGTFEVAPSDSLVRNDYANMGTTVLQADWMLMGAIRNNDDALFVWTGEQATLPGITFPEEIVKWLNATGLYQSIDNRVGSTVDALRSKGFNAAEKLEVVEGTDIIVLVHTNILADALKQEVEGGFLSHFSNHWIVLLANVVRNVETDRVHFPIWTWGKDRETCEVPNVSFFADNYYGAIVAKLK